VSVPFSKNCDDPVGIGVMDSTADFTTVCTECRIEDGMKFAISTCKTTRAFFTLLFVTVTSEKKRMILNSLSLSLFYAHTKEKKRSLSLFLSLAFGARTNHTTRSNERTTRFFSSQKTTQGSTDDFCVFVCSARF
jgi:hypothetical protein